MTLKTIRQYINVNPALLVGLIALLTFVALCIGISLTKRPWSDEGWFAATGYNLFFHHSMGNPVLEPRGFLEGINQYTYWTAPLYYPLQAIWYWIWGFSLFSMRSLSTFFGLMFLMSWFSITKQLMKDPSVALLTLVFLAFDYLVVMDSSFGRMDIICAAFGAASIAVYFRQREQKLAQAIFISQLLVVLSGMTHFLGLLYFVALNVLIFQKDRSHIRAKHIFIGLIPYLVFGVAWGVYILQAPALFLTQFFGNATQSNRMGGFSNPLVALYSEILFRYLPAYGLGQHPVHSPVTVYLKSVTLLAFVIGALMCFCIGEIRRAKGMKTLIWGWAIFFLMLSILDGQKLSYYLVNVIPFYTIFLSTSFIWLWRRHEALKPLLALGTVLLLCLPVSGLLLKMSANDYRNTFLPAADFIRRHTGEDTRVCASAEMAFQLGFEGSVIDDHWLGYNRDRQPDFYVLEEVYEEALEGKRLQKPEVYEYVMSNLQEHYTLVYDQNRYKVFMNTINNSSAK
jgi:4-amino-4-deoxy-L-arabinose transferase-like glycosyltransferase